MLDKVFEFNDMKKVFGAGMPPEKKTEDKVPQMTKQET
jgi:hypothetical protein